MTKLRDMMVTMLAFAVGVLETVYFKRSELNSNPSSTLQGGINGSARAMLSELRFLVGPPMPDWSSTQRYKGRNLAKGALVKIQEVPVPATGGSGRSVNACVENLRQTGSFFSRVGLGSLPPIKSQSILFNEQPKQRYAVPAREDVGSTRPGWKPIQESTSKYLTSKKTLWPSRPQYC